LAAAADGLAQLDDLAARDCALDVHEGALAVDVAAFERLPFLGS